MQKIEFNNKILGFFQVNKIPKVFQVFQVTGNHEQENIFQNSKFFIRSAKCPDDPQHSFH